MRLPTSTSMPSFQLLKCLLPQSPLKMAYIVTKNINFMLAGFILTTV